MIAAEISIKTIKRNLKKLRASLQGQKICAVVKANAYGLGDVVIASAIVDQVDCFAVANIREAVRLREHNIIKPILLIGVCEDLQTAIERSIIITIQSLREAKNLARVILPTQKCKIHIKVNTGMNRYGITTLWQLKKILDAVKPYPNIKVDGLYTHLAFEYNNPCGIAAQLKRFASFRTMIKSNHPNAIIHAAASGSITIPDALFDMVRVGKLLYGGIDGYQTVINVTSNIAAVQTVSACQKVGYYGTYTTSKSTIIGVVPCGYADVAHFSYGNSLTVLVDNHSCRVLGRICMDTLMIDVTEVPKPLGKIVTLISSQRGQTLMDISRSCETIVCNLLCCLNFNRCKVTYKA